MSYTRVIGGLIIVSIRPDKIADIEFVGGLLLRMKASDKKTFMFVFLSGLFLRQRRRKYESIKW